MNLSSILFTLHTKLTEERNTLKVKEREQN